MEPVFLTLLDVLEIHAEQIELYGGEIGVRDITLLESALAVPRSGIDQAYFHDDVFAMSAAYLFHIVNNHPFVDGNKRTGLACAYLFLAINGYELECDPDEFAEMVLDVAKGGLDKAGVTEFMRLHAIESDV